MGTPLHKYYSIEEYLVLEEQSTEKHEYYRGEIFALAGASARHNIIVTNLIIGLGSTLKGSGCQVFGSDMKVHIPNGSMFAYPDVSVVCGKQEYYNEKQTALLNPTLIIEVLSPSTAAYDLVTKFALYRALPSLQEYAVFEQERQRAELFCKQASGKWEISSQLEDEQTLHFASINCTLSLDDIYFGTGAAL